MDIKIKPLEWIDSRSGPDEYLIFAPTVMNFRYEIAASNRRFLVTRSCDIQPFAWADLIDSAKAKAMDDYEARIRSTLA